MARSVYPFAPATEDKIGFVNPPCAIGWRPTIFSNARLSVSKALADQSIFLTGATGFVGSVLLEQLLRVCPTVKRIFVLIRVKHGQSGQERLAQLLRKKLFHLHWKGGEVPLDVRNKIVVVPGDMDAPGLGLSDADRQSLQAEVDFVFHSAASISFFEHVHTLLKQNYEATRKTVELARGMQRLRGFIHVSTAYVNSNLPRGSHIEERIYPLHDAQGARIQHAALAARLAALPPAKAEHTAQGVLRATGLPNCYTLTKHMCEELVYELHSAKFPVAIVRPTIIGAIAKAPLPGYFGNTAGVTTMVLAFATGMARFTCHNPQNVYDIIPCDIVASTILAAASLLQQTPEAAAAGALIMHSGSSCTNPYSYHDLYTNVVHPFWSADPPQRRLCSKPYKRIGHPTTFVPEDSMIFKAMRLKHGIRFRLLAAGLHMAGQHKLCAVVLNSWKTWKLYNTSTMDFHLFYCTRNTQALEALLAVEERQQAQLVWGPSEDWAQYLTVHMEAIRAKYFPAEPHFQSAAAAAPCKILPTTPTMTKDVVVTAV